MRVDLPAPFSPMSEWTSPGNMRKLTPSSALTPGKEIEMSVISTTGVGVGMSALPRGRMLLLRVWWVRGAVAAHPPRVSRTLLVLAVGQSRLGLLLVEGRLLRDDALLDRAAIV